VPHVLRRREEARLSNAGYPAELRLRLAKFDWEGRQLYVNFDVVRGGTDGLCEVHWSSRFGSKYFVEVATANPRVKDVREVTLRDLAPTGSRSPAAMEAGE
jgi:hypothetical protein